MLCNINILAGMDLRLCCRLWIHLIALLYEGYSRQSFVILLKGILLNNRGSTIYRTVQ